MRPPRAAADRFLRSLALALALAAAARAEAPMVKTQAPGFYRMPLGVFEVTALSDGTAPLAAHEVLRGIPPDAVRAALAKVALTSPVETSFNAYLVNTGPKLVLVDTGSGTSLGPSLGHLRENLIASGYRPEQVDEIYLTHLHVDHAGGLVAGGERAFPNAVVRVDRHDVDYWLSDANRDAAPEAMKMFFEGARGALTPYREAGRLATFDGDTELVPGVRAVASRGHTPGHSVIVAESGGERIVFFGDLMHVAAVQFPHPDVTVMYDVDGPAAAAQRRKFFADVAERGALAGISHVSFPGIGRLRAAGDGYEFIPVNYTSPR